MAEIFTNENGYREEIPVRHSNLIHRKIAYYGIYLPNKEKFKLPFRAYVIHHINGIKEDNRIENLKLLTHKEHRRIHFSKANDKKFIEEVHKLIHALRKIEGYQPSLAEMQLSRMVTEEFKESCEECKARSLKKRKTPKQRSFFNWIQEAIEK